MITDTELERLERLVEAASPGQWGLWVESTPTKEDAIRELVEQVENVPDQDFAGAVFLLDAAGKCPATTGCGPTSRANADFILAVQPSNTLALISSVRELRARAEAAEAENERLRKALDDIRTGRGKCGTCGSVAVGDRGGVVTCDCAYPVWSPQNAQKIARLALENTNG